MATRGNSALKCIRFLYVFCNAVVALIGKGMLVLTILAQLDILKGLKLLYEYENLNFEIIFGSSIVILINSSLGVISGSMKFDKGIILNASLSVTYVLSALGYAIKVGITADYTPNGELYRQLRRQFGDYNHNRQTVDELQSTLLCSGVSNSEQRMTIGAGTSWAQDISTCAIGCFDALKILIAFYGVAVCVLLGFVTIISIISVVLSYPLYRSIKDKQKSNIEKVEEQEEEKTEEGNPGEENPEKENPGEESPEKEISEEESPGEESKIESIVVKQPESEQTAKSVTFEVQKLEDSKCRNICQDITPRSCVILNFY